MSESRSKVKLVTIGDDGAGQRLDNYLLKYLKGVPKSVIYRIVRKGEVRVNKKRAGPSHKLEINDVVRIPPLMLPKKTNSQPLLPRLLSELTANILYEDADLLIINKPSGIAVHAGSGVTASIVETLRHIYPKIELAHRLDRETSGCLLLAKKYTVLSECHDLMRNQKCQKVYNALVQGSWSPDQHTLEWPLIKNILQSGERMVQVSRAGKPALTWFKPLEHFQDPQTTLVEATLGTGRTHQIRVHATHAGHPLAGDDKYGDRDFNRVMQTLGLKRLFLHAAQLSFTRVSGQQISVQAELPTDLQKILHTLHKT